MLFCTTGCSQVLWDQTAVTGGYWRRCVLGRQMWVPPAWFVWNVDFQQSWGNIHLEVHCEFQKVSNLKTWTLLVITDVLSQITWVAFHISLFQIISSISKIYKFPLLKVKLQSDACYHFEHIFPFRLPWFTKSYCYANQISS